MGRCDKFAHLSLEALEVIRKAARAHPRLEEQQLCPQVVFTVLSSFRFPRVWRILVQRGGKRHIRLTGGGPIALKACHIHVEVDVARADGQANCPFIVSVHQISKVGIRVASPVQVSPVVFGGFPVGARLTDTLVVIDHPTQAQQVDCSKFSTVIHHWFSQYKAKGFGARHVVLSDVAHEKFLKHRGHLGIVVRLVGDVLDSVLEAFRSRRHLHNVLEQVLNQLVDALHEPGVVVAAPAENEL